MKPLHTSSQVTASDSRMVVRVGELSTPDGPVRRIVVEANAEMDTTEARWLRDKLDLAITLAEEQPEDPCACPTLHKAHWLTSDATDVIKRKYVACHCQIAEDHDGRGRTWTVSEDQPKPREPRVWREGDAEPEDLPKVRDKQHDVWTYDPISGLWYTPDTTPFEWQRVVKKWGPLSEVLADSEQVRHG